MKKFTKFLAAGLALTLVFGLTACGGGSDATPTPSAEKTPEVVASPEAGNDAEATPEATSEGKINQVEEIKAAGKLVMGTEAGFPPFEFLVLKDGKEEIKGLDVSIMQAVADKLGVELEIQNLDFDALIPEMQSGKVDVIAAGFSIDEERAKVVDFSDPYAEVTQKVVIRKEDLETYTSIDSLKGKQVGGQKGSVQEDVVTEVMPESELLALGKVGGLVLELKTGRIEALVLESVIAESYVKANPELAIAEIELPTPVEEYAVAVPKNSDLLDVVNEVLAELKESGELDQMNVEASALFDSTQSDE